jgi:hypothetical protein
MIVDEHLKQSVKSHRWSLSRKGYLRSTFSVSGTARRNWFVHQYVWFIANGKVPRQLDHINGNRLDNRLENLREANDFVNGQNKHVVNKKSGLPQGVRFEKDCQKYSARIMHRRKSVYLGLHKTPEDASAAYAATKVMIMLAEMAAL